MQIQYVSMINGPKEAWPPPWVLGPVLLAVLLGLLVPLLVRAGEKVVEASQATNAGDGRQGEL